MTAPLREGSIRSADAPVLDERSRRRLAGSAIFALAAIAALLVLLPSRLEPAQRVPTSIGAGPEDFLAFARTLQALALPSERLLSTYGNLPEASDHVLVTLAPSGKGAEAANGAVRLDAAQTRALASWVRSGGHWLVALPHGQPGSEQEPWADAGTESPYRGDDDPLSIIDDLPSTEWVTAQGTVLGHGPLDDILGDFAPRGYLAGEWPAALRRVDDGPAKLRVFSDAPDGWASILELDGRPLALIRPEQTGTVLLVSTPLLFQNLALGALGTGTLAVRLVHAAAERGRRRVLLDEFAHGLGHERGLWWIARRHGFGGLLVALAVVLIALGWRGAVRRAPAIATDTVNRRAASEFVVALADVARRGGRARRTAERFLEGQVLLARRRGDREALRRLTALEERLAQRRGLEVHDLRELVREVDSTVLRHDHPSPTTHGAHP